MIVKLPWAPTANKIWRTGRNGVTYLSKDYRSFLDRAKISWLEQRSPRVESGNVEVVVRLFPPDSRGYDTDNRIKPTLDAMTKIGVWEDDRIVRKITAISGAPVSGGAIVVEIYRHDAKSVDPPEEFGLKRKENADEKKRKVKK